MRNRKLRLFYLLAFTVTCGIEILIALFVRDSFIRPYIGDVLVVIVLYCFVRFFIPERVKWLPVYIFIFSLVVEFFQLADIVSWLGLRENAFVRILIGSTFDFADILCYAVGCGVLLIWEFVKDDIFSTGANGK